jgi:nucleoside-diphosphate-sugar epimerase
MARILIVGGGCRGRALAASSIAAGDAVRVTTRTERGRAAIEATGAECYIGDPDRLATMRASLDRATVLCWLMGCATGGEEQLEALHSTRLEFFLTQAIDTTVRGVVYERSGEPAALLADGARRAQAILERNLIPAAYLHAQLGESAAWLAEATAAVDGLLGRS